MYVHVCNILVAHSDVLSDGTFNVLVIWYIRRFHELHIQRVWKYPGTYLHYNFSMYVIFVFFPYIIQGWNR